MKVYKLINSFQIPILIQSLHVEAQDTLPRYSGLLGLSKSIEFDSKLLIDFDGYKLIFIPVKNYILDRTYYYDIEDASGFYGLNALGRNWFFQTGTSIVDMLKHLLTEKCIFEGVNGVLGNPVVIGRSIPRGQAILNIINDLCLDIYYTDTFVIRDIPKTISKSITVDTWSENYTSGQRYNSITVSGVIRGGAYSVTVKDYEDIIINGEASKIYESKIVCDKYNLERLANLLLEKQSRYEYTIKIPTQDVKINDLIIIKNNRLNQAKKLRVTKLVITGNLMEVTGANIAS